MNFLSGTTVPEPFELLYIILWENSEILFSSCLLHFCAINERVVVVDQMNSIIKFVKLSWRCGVVVITTTQLHSTKPELRFCAGSNPARGVPEISDGEDL